MPGRVLIVEDNASMSETVGLHLRTRGFTVEAVERAEEALELTRRGDFDVVLTDLKMPGMDGLELCERLAANRPDIPVVLITAFGNMSTAVAALRAGAYDFVTKPIALDLLELGLERAIRHRSLLETIRSLSEAVDQDRGATGELLGRCEAMAALKEDLRRVAGSDVSVLITGESGTGKELVARAIHQASPRRAGPFLAINCAALPAALLENELFGHESGAYTGAGAAHKGLVFAAEGGTLFLDEIGDIALELQPKLLRALEERRARPVGGSAERPFDVRILAATNRDLESEVEEGLFREDLYFRLNVIQLELPPLRARGADILLLARAFLERFARRHHKDIRGIAAPAAEKLLDYRWPGNVRELRNVIERAVVLARMDQLLVDDLPEKIRAYKGRDLVLGAGDPGELLPLKEVERRYIAYVLEAAGGNKTLAAKILGFDRKTLYRKLNQGPEGRP